MVGYPTGLNIVLLCVQRKYLKLAALPVYGCFSTNFLHLIVPCYPEIFLISFSPHINHLAIMDVALQPLHDALAQTLAPDPV